MAEIGFEITGADAGWYYADDERPGIACLNCQSVTNHDFVSRAAEVKRGRDFAFTYDGHLLVSDRFRRFCLDSGYGDVVFEAATAKGDYFDLRPTRVLNVDVIRSKCRFTAACTSCGQFVGIHSGVGTIFKDVATPLVDGFYRTDIYWAHAWNKAPEFIVAPETRRKIKAAGFRGLVYFAIMPPEIEMLGRPQKAYR